MTESYFEGESLADGSAPLEPAALLEELKDLGIEARTVEHAPVYTVEESKAECGELAGAHIKNLFLRNKKGRMWLVTCLEDRPVDLKALGDLLEAGRFSFGSAERLMSYLGVRPGAVTPFAVVNDKGGEVTMVLDQAILDHPLVNAHPLVNHMTTALTPADLLKFLESVGHRAQLLDIGRAARAES